MRWLGQRLQSAVRVSPLSGMISGYRPQCLTYCAHPSAHSYRTLATEHESLMQKHLHLLQIVETEKTVAKQLRQQIEDGEVEIERLKAEVTQAPHPALPTLAPHRSGGT